MKYFFLILVFVIGASPSLFGQAPIPTNPNGAIEQQLKTLMQTEYTAGQRNDTATIDRIWAAEYTSTGPKGSVANKAQMLNYYKTAPLSQTRLGPLMLSDVQVHTYGDVAVMTGRVTGTNQIGRPSGASLRFTRLHTGRKGQWLVVASHLSRVEPAPQVKTK